jgi:hypothetical protein
MHLVASAERVGDAAAGDAGEGARTTPHPVVHGEALRQARLQHECRKPQLANQESQHAITDPVELGDEVRAFAETDHPGVTDHLAQHVEVGVVAVGGINSAQRQRDITDGLGRHSAAPHTGRHHHDQRSSVGAAVHTGTIRCPGAEQVSKGHRFTRYASQRGAAHPIEKRGVHRNEDTAIGL